MGNLGPTAFDEFSIPAKTPYIELASFETSMVFHYNIRRLRKSCHMWGISRLDIFNGIRCGIWSSLATVLVVDVLAAFRR